MILNIKLIARKESAAWSIGQYAVGRAATALGWIIVARSTGPVEFGHFSILLIALAVLEAISMPGLNQAIVQRIDDQNVDPAPIWIIQCARGVFLALAVSLVVALFYPSTISAVTAPVVGIFASHIVIKNIQSLWSVSLQRDNNFRTLFVFDFTIAVSEIVSILTLIRLGFDPITSFFVGLLIGSILRTSTSWIFGPHKIVAGQVNSDFWELVRYGRWIWLSSILIVAANFTDKIVASTLPADELGRYQLAGRFAQLIFADWAAAYGAFLFPRMSHLRRVGALGSRYIVQKLVLVVTGNLLVGLIILSLPMSIVVTLFGSDWNEAADLFRVQALAMTIGASIALLSAAVKAIGQPNLLFVGLTIQVSMLSLTVLPLYQIWGLYGLIYANTLGLSGCAAVLLVFVWKNRL